MLSLFGLAIISDNESSDSFGARPLLGSAQADNDFGSGRAIIGSGFGNQDSGNGGFGNGGFGSGGFGGRSGFGKCSVCIYIEL